jgi:hypothetical protein
MMTTMESAPVVQLPTGATRNLRMLRAIAAKRRLEESATRGRAWINGREVGGADQRYAHLARSHD